MAKYRKKPVVIEAVQLLNNDESILDCLNFIDRLDCDAPAWVVYEEIKYVKEKEGLDIPTKEGNLKASFNDWIVQGYTELLGNHYWPVKPDYFEQNYEPLEPIIGYLIKGDIIL